MFLGKPNHGCKNNLATVKVFAANAKTQLVRDELLRRLSASTLIFIFIIAYIKNHDRDVIYYLQKIKPFWSPMWAGIALGLVLLLTFVLTGHGLGATGASTRLTAWLGTEVAPQATHANAYLGPLTQGGNPLPSWITWQVVGVAMGALASACLGGRFRFQFDGALSVGTPRRIFTALVGGMLAGFGARVAAGCTSGLDLSGAATLGVSAFLFLDLFFATGLITSRLVKGV